jgi:hypothetical protein
MFRGFFFSLTPPRIFILLDSAPPNEQQMEESMSQNRPTWRERLQMAAQIAALISSVCGMTIAYYAHTNAKRVHTPPVTTQNHPR